jgi:uncharacterized protein
VRAKPAADRPRVPLVVFADTVAVCRLDPAQPLPSWAQVREGEFFSITCTRNELSIILPQGYAPKAAKCERDWRILGVKGPVDFTLVGILAGLSGTLADAGISIFSVSTHDTDYILVKCGDLDRAVAALRQAGYSVTGP